MFAIIAANHYRSVGSSQLKILQPSLSNRQKKNQTHNKKLNLWKKNEFSCSVCSQNQWIVEKILKNNTNNYCFKGTSRMGMEVIRTDQIKKPTLDLGWKS